MIWLLVLVIVHVVAAGIFTSRVLKPERLWDLAVVHCLTAMTSFYAFPVIIGTITGLMNTYVILGAAVLTVGIAAGCFFRMRPGANYPALLISRLKKLKFTEVALAVLILGYLLVTLGIGSIFPVRIWDASNYHIMGPMRWVQSGKFIFDSFGDPVVNPNLAAGEVYPNVKGILPFLVMLWTGDTVGTAMVQWPYLYLLVLSLMAIYRRLELSLSTSFTSVLFVLSAPEMMLQSIEAYADLAYFAGVSVVIWVCLRLWQEGPSKVGVLVAALAFALLAATKTTALVACGVLGAVYMITLFIRLNGISFSQRTRYVAVAIGFIIIVALCVAGPWYLHALIKLKNPGYPMEVTVLGKTIFPGPYPTSMNSDYVTNYTGRKGFSAWWGMMSEEWRPPSLSSWSSGLGPSTFIIGMPCTVLFLLVCWFRWNARGTVLVVTAFMGLAITSPAAVLARFFMFMLGLGGLAIGKIAEQLLPRVPRFILLSLVLGFAGYSVYITLPSIMYRQRPPHLVAFNLLSGYARSAKMDVYPDEYSAVDYWLDKVATPASLIVTHDIIAWNLFSPLRKPDVLFIKDKKEESFEQWKNQLKATKATHVILQRNNPRFVQAINPNSGLKLLFHGITAHVYRAPFMDPPPNAGLFEVVK